MDQTDLPDQLNRKNLSTSRLRLLCLCKMTAARKPTLLPTTTGAGVQSNRLIFSRRIPISAFSLSINRLYQQFYPSAKLFCTQ